jgi:hypothetical protein
MANRFVFVVSQLASRTRGGVLGMAIVLATLVTGCAVDEGDPEVVSTVAEAELKRCQRDSDCPVVGVPCRECSDGSFVCPESTCQAGRCILELPRCERQNPCATVLCPNGTECVVRGTPPRPICVPQPVFCGGIAAIPCPGAGKCVDDHRDTCNPREGGADCSGLCRCPAFGRCVGGQRWDPSPSVCACVPAP